MTSFTPFFVSKRLKMHEFHVKLAFLQNYIRRTLATCYLLNNHGQTPLIEKERAASAGRKGSTECQSRLIQGLEGH